MVVCYSLWAFERDGANAGWFFAVTIIPITVAILRLSVDVDGGLAGEPEEIALKDRVLQLCSCMDRNHRCRPSSSAERIRKAGARRLARWPAFPYDIPLGQPLGRRCGGELRCSAGCLGAALDRR